MEDAALDRKNTNDSETPSRPSTFRFIAPGKSISGIPYRFNIDGRPHERVLMEQHTTHFKSALDWERAQNSFMWRIEPDLRIIKEVIGPVLSQIALTAKHLTVEIFAQGSFNKTYLITACHESCSFSDSSHVNSTSSNNGATSTYRSPYSSITTKLQLLLRLYLPVFPWYKTESEVTTMEYLRSTTTIPIPRVYAFDSSSNNPIGFEWILMEKPAGQPYSQLVEKVKVTHKKAVLNSISSYAKSLARLHFDKIGSLYCNWDVPKMQFYIGPAVDMEFLKANQCLHQTERVPLSDLRKYFETYLKLKIEQVGNIHRQQRAQGALDLLKEMERQSTEAGEGMNIPENKAYHDQKRTIEALQSFQRVISNSTILGQKLVITRLYKHNMGESSIFVDEKGNVTAVLDWDATFAVPDCLAEKDTDISAFGNALPRRPRLTNEQMDQILEAKDTGKKQGVAMGRVIKVLAGYMFMVEEDLPGAERWIGKLEKCGILN